MAAHIGNAVRGLLTSVDFAVLQIIVLALFAAVGMTVRQLPGFAFRSSATGSRPPQPPEPRRVEPAEAGRQANRQRRAELDTRPAPIRNPGLPAGPGWSV